MSEMGMITERTAAGSSQRVYPRRLTVRCPLPAPGRTIGNMGAAAIVTLAISAVQFGGDGTGSAEGGAARRMPL